MCGIVGLLQRDPQATPPSRLLWGMLDPLKNRGPDGQHIWTASGIGLGHARLSILDLDARSNQPMLDPETGCVLTYNGEIYNYLELRDTLAAQGYTFRTSGDTEVILKAYEHWGVDCLQHFNGMWAFALYDPRSKSLFCARDRFGIKPFVYAHANGDLVFASEAKALLAAFPQLDVPHTEFLRHFVETGFFAGSETTFYQDIFNLLPGHFFVTSHGETPAPRRYWTLDTQSNDPPPSWDEAISGFKTLLADSVRLRFRSDVPVGTCLSGGLDSSTLVAVASKLFSTPITTFSCIYPNFPEVDESYYIHQITGRFGCKAHWTTPQYPNILESMVQSIYEQDGPTGTPAVLSQRAVMALAHGNVTVLLDGQGGDEVLGGYHSYFPYSLQALLRESYSSGTPWGLFKFWMARHHILRRTQGKFVPKFHHMRKKARRSPQFERSRFGKTCMDGLTPFAHDDLNTRMMEDLFLSLSNLLHYEDRNSMAFSLESRLPFLDYRLVEFLFRLPHTFKIQNERTKRLLYETVQHLLPPAVVQRKDKMGFATPGQHWLSQPDSASYLTHLLASPPDALEGLNHGFRAKLQSGWLACQQGVPIAPSHEAALWRYFTACLWLTLDTSPKPSRPSLMMV